ncbi:hypothetical protein P7K49_004459, partial [Saguinus oedipus]
KAGVAPTPAPRSPGANAASFCDVNSLRAAGAFHAHGHALCAPHGVHLRLELAPLKAPCPGAHS